MKTVKNPTGPKNGSYRVVRGGSWAGHARTLRSAARAGNPGYRAAHVGFRLVRIPMSIHSFTLDPSSIEAREAIAEINVLDQWDKDAEAFLLNNNLYTDKEDQKRIRALINIIRKKDDKIRYALGPTRDVKTPHLQEALALTKELK
jgi:hypothetical protein